MIYRCWPALPAVFILLTGCLTLRLDMEGEVAKDWSNGSTHCHVHDRELLEDIQPVSAACMYDNLYDARQIKFPFAMDDLWGGGGFAKVMYCPDCRMAKTQWIKQLADNNDISMR